MSTLSKFNQAMNDLRLRKEQLEAQIADEIYVLATPVRVRLIDFIQEEIKKYDNVYNISWCQNPNDYDDEVYYFSNDATDRNWCLNGWSFPDAGKWHGEASIEDEEAYGMAVKCAVIDGKDIGVLKNISDDVVESINSALQSIDDDNYEMLFGAAKITVSKDGWYSIEDYK